MGFENIGYAPRNMDTFGSILTTTKNLALAKGFISASTPRDVLPAFRITVCSCAESPSRSAEKRLIEVAFIFAISYRIKRRAVDPATLRVYVAHADWRYGYFQFF